MRKSALILENDPDTMKVLAAIVGELDIHPVCVGNAIDSSLIEKLTPNLILVDQRFDNTSGRDLCRELKSNPLTQHIPVIMISGSPDVKKPARNGADAFITRPFPVEKLESVILRLIK